MYYAQTNNSSCLMTFLQVDQQIDTPLLPQIGITTEQSLVFTLSLDLYMRN